MNRSILPKEQKHSFQIGEVEFMGKLVSINQKDFENGVLGLNHIWESLQNVLPASKCVELNRGIRLRNFKSDETVNISDKHIPGYLPYLEHAKGSNLSL